MRFKKFIEDNSRYKKFYDNDIADSLFTFMSKPVNIDKMIMANDKGRPALEGILPDVENKFNDVKFDIESDYFVRQFIGVMVREVIKDFGYTVDRSEKNRQKNINSRFITSATHYKKVPESATKKIKKVITIVKI